MPRARLPVAVADRPCDQHQPDSDGLAERAAQYAVMLAAPGKTVADTDSER